MPGNTIAVDYDENEKKIVTKIIAASEDAVEAQA